MTIWFTADTHFGHEKILEHEPGRCILGSSIDEHDESLIRNWNSVVGKHDEVWHLGDFAYRNKRATLDYVRALNGKIHLVRGNHDDKTWKHPEYFASIHEARYIRWEGAKIWLCHYNCRVWRNWRRGTWHLYGHSHGGLHDLPGRCLDVGIDCHNLFPVSFETVRARLDAIPPPPESDPLL